MPVACGFFFFAPELATSQPIPPLKYDSLGAGFTPANYNGKCFSSLRAFPGAAHGAF